MEQKTIKEFEIESPFTDPEERYTVTNSKEEYCYRVHNLETGKTYTVNPYTGICDCMDFQYRTNGGSCKHIDFLRNNKRIKPFLEKYNNNFNNPFPEKNAGPHHTPEIVEQNHNNILPYSLMERKDEDQIIAELEGNIIKEYVYDFEQNGKKILGLSYSGVLHIALQMGHICTGEPIIQEMNGGYIAKVCATDTKRNVSTWGVSFQPKKMKLKNGNFVDDQFAITKVVAKSTRNAMRRLFDEKVILKLIEAYTKQKAKGVKN